jgi:membrane protease YdiL (CAAX protease family)
MAMAIAGFAVYIGYAQFIEQRAVSELALRGLRRELGIGLLIGAGLYTVCELILMVLGSYRINGLNPLSHMIPAIAMALSSSVFEELLFRGSAVPVGRDLVRELGCPGRVVDRVRPDPPD